MCCVYICSDILLICLIHVIRYLCEISSILENGLSKVQCGIVRCRYLHYSFTDAVRSQDTLYVLRSVSSNIYGRSITWNFLRNNWAILKDRYCMHIVIIHCNRSVICTVRSDVCVSMSSKYIWSTVITEYSNAKITIRLSPIIFIHLCI